MGKKRHSNRQQQTVLSGIADWNLKVTGRGAEPGKERRRRGKTERREKSGQHNSLGSPGSGCVAHSLCYFVRVWKCEWEVFKASPCRRILQSHPALCISSIYRHFPLHTPVVSLSFFLSATSRTAACPPHLRSTVVTSLWRYHSSSFPNFFHHHPSTADTSILAKHDLILLTLLNLLLLCSYSKQGPRLYVFFYSFSSITPVLLFIHLDDLSMFMLLFYYHTSWKNSYPIYSITILSVLFTPSGPDIPFYLFLLSSIHIYHIPRNGWKLKGK